MFPFCLTWAKLVRYFIRSVAGFFNPNVDVSRRATVANYGLMDQLAALHWVQENIERFDGDPKQVTVMGHGTGAACLNFLIISPATTGKGSIKSYPITFEK